MRILVLIGALGLWACQANLSESELSAPGPLPAAATFALPDDPDAAKMTEDYFAIMDKKMELATRIGPISTRDKYVREVFIDMFKDPDLDPDVRSAFQDAGGKYVTAIDALNTRELKAAMQDFSWRDLVETESRLFERAFHVVQHSPDQAYKAEVLAEIKPLAEEGLIRGSLYALMYDRVEINAGREQLYGTQYKCIDGEHTAYELANPDSVDERRAQMGLEPLSDYLKQGLAIYGPCK